MQVADWMAISASFALLLAPGWIAAGTALRRATAAERFFLGSTAGLGTTASLGAAVTATWGFDAIPAALAALYAGAAWIAWRARSSVRGESGRMRYGAALAAMLALAFASRCIPLYFSELPLGIDPTFHLVLAQKILLERALPTDWSPFEALPVHYIAGTHLVLAIVASLSGAPVHEVFKLAFPIGIAISVAGVWSVARVILRDESAAAWASAAYAFLAVWGSLDYYRWGGLPALLGLSLQLGVVWLLLTDLLSTRLCAALAALLLVALSLIHNHSTLTALLVLGSWLAAVALETRLRDRVSQRIAASLMLALPIAVIANLGSTAGVFGARDTELFRFYEWPLPLWTAIARIGGAFALVAVPGLVLLLKRIDTVERLFLLVWLTALFAAFCVLEYVYRFAVFALSGEFYSALTPSRFLTAMVYPLSLCAGLAIREALRRMTRPRLLAAALIFLMAVVSFAQLGSQCRSEQADLVSLRWIRDHTPTDAFVLDNDPWMPYVAWREGTFTALPSSESRNHESLRRKRELVTPEARARFARSAFRPVYRFADAAAAPEDGFQIVFRTGRSSIHEWIAAAGDRTH